MLCWYFVEIPLLTQKPWLTPNRKADWAAHSPARLVEKPVPIAMKQEVRSGAAQIYTTISGRSPQCYDIVGTESVNLSPSSKTKGMVIRVTDPELLEATGGILQGERAAALSCRAASWLAPSPMSLSTTRHGDTVSLPRICRKLLPGFSPDRQPEPGLPEAAPPEDT